MKFVPRFGCDGRRRQRLIAVIIHGCDALEEQVANRSLVSLSPTSFNVKRRKCSSRLSATTSGCRRNEKKIRQPLAHRGRELAAKFIRTTSGIAIGRALAGLSTGRLTFEGGKDPLRSMRLSRESGTNVRAQGRQPSRGPRKIENSRSPAPQSNDLRVCPQMRRNLAGRAPKRSV